MLNYTTSPDLSEKYRFDIVSAPVEKVIFSQKVVPEFGYFPTRLKIALSTDKTNLYKTLVFF